MAYGVRDNVRRMAATATDRTEIGARIKALREAMDLSLRDLAERSGVSAPMLSQVERGETPPDARRRREDRRRPRADAFAAAAPRRGRRRHRRARGERLEGGHADGHRYEVLTPPLPGQRAEVSLHTLAPGAATGGPGDPPMHEPGSRETAVALKGVVRLVCDGVAHDLEQGDAVTFDADLPHHFENPGRREAQFMSVIAAGLRRS